MVATSFSDSATPTSYSTSYTLWGLSRTVTAPQLGYLIASARHSPNIPIGKLYFAKSTDWPIFFNADIERPTNSVKSLTWAEFQHSVVYYATDQCQKRLEACINAEGGHSEHLLWHFLPDIPVATRHNRFFSGPPMTTHNWLSSEPATFERTQQTFGQINKSLQFTS